MASYPATTVKVTSIEPCGETKVLIKMDMVVDVHRLAEVGSELLHAAVTHAKAESKKKKSSV
jgi:hypothetical protein